MRITALSVAALLLLSAVAAAAPYSNAASFWGFGSGARAVALGGAFVGLADDESALFYNPAGLAWGSRMSVLSSIEVRPAMGTYGHVTACFENLGCGIHYFDFGDILSTDDSGNVTGSFSYRNYGLVAGMGISAADVPFFSTAALADCVSFGLSARLTAVDTLEAGDGTGITTDVSLLLRAKPPWFAQPYLSTLGFGFILRNLFALPISYGSGHSEDWTRSVSLGLAIELLEKVTATMEFRSTKSAHLGFEWSPVAALAVRCGVKYAGVPMWSFGIGAKLKGFAVDIAVATHPYLSSQIRGSLGFYW